MTGNDLKEIWKQLRTWRRNLKNSGPEERKRDCANCVPWAERTVHAIEDSLADAERSYRWMWELWTGLPSAPDLKPHVWYYQVVAAWIMRVGAWGGVLFECLVAGALSILIFNLPAAWAVLIGVLITIVVTY